VRNVLIVEDDPGLATMLSDALATRHYRIWHASDASEVEALLDHCRPDIIIVDLMLPDRIGLILCNELKNRVAAPVIMCSATKRKDDAVIG
jgi:two-component system OmpR family response regulator